MRRAYPLVVPILWSLAVSWRLRSLDDMAATERLAAGGEPAIVAIWHSDLLPVGFLLHRRLVRRGLAVSALVSRSTDGEILARSISPFGFGTIRGSTSRGGLAALRAVVRETERGGFIVIAPDGPRGPARVAKSGIVQVAAATGAPIVPMAGSARHVWRARSWDRLQIPKPFTEVVVARGEEMRFERGVDYEREAARLAKTLRGVAERVGAAVRGA